MILTVVIENFPDDLYKMIWENQIQAGKDIGHIITETNNIEIDWNESIKTSKQSAYKLIQVLFSLRNAIEGEKSVR